MPKLEWNRPQDQTFEAGLDRGVIYVEDGPAVAWSGLASVEDGGESTLKEFYIDGIKYLSMVSPRDYKGLLVAYTFPDEFGELIGISELGDGLYVDSQAPGRFGLSYRTMVSTPALDKKQHYKIHLIYKVMASMSSRTYQSLTNEAVDPTSFEFDLAAVPIKIPGRRPSAHIILDTRKIDEETFAQLETIIYGSDTQDAAMPTIDQLIDLMAYGDEVKIHINFDGTWTATGSNKNVHMVDDKAFEILNVDATYETDTIYRFNDATGEASTNVLVFDSDGVPYMTVSLGDSNVAVDDDNIPYIKMGADEVTIKKDVDDEPYFEIN